MLSWEPAATAPRRAQACRNKEQRNQLVGPKYLEPARQQPAMARRTITQNPLVVLYYTNWALLPEDAASPAEAG